MHVRHPQSYQLASAHPGSELAGSRVGMGAERTVQQGSVCCLVHLQQLLDPLFPRKVIVDEGLDAELQNAVEDLD